MRNVFLELDISDRLLIYQSDAIQQKLMSFLKCGTPPRGGDERFLDKQ
jgi:hypothetical protein